MILYCAENDILPFRISLYDGNSVRNLTHDSETGSWEAIRLRCKVSTQDGGESLLNAETDKEASGATGQTAVNYLAGSFDMRAVKAVPGKYPLEVSLVNYVTVGTQEKERSKQTLVFADESYLYVHGEVGT